MVARKILAVVLVVAVVLVAAIFFIPTGSKADTPVEPVTNDPIDIDGLAPDTVPCVGCTDDDIDGDGVLNDDDGDQDGDGTPNEDDFTPEGDTVLNGTANDIDGDGIVNDADVDDDGDGTPDATDPWPNGEGLPTPLTGNIHVKTTIDYIDGTQKILEGDTPLLSVLKELETGKELSQFMVEVTVRANYALAIAPQTAVLASVYCDQDSPACSTGINGAFVSIQRARAGIIVPADTDTLLVRYIVGIEDVKNKVIYLGTSGLNAAVIKFFSVVYFSVVGQPGTGYKLFQFPSMNLLISRADGGGGGGGGDFCKAPPCTYPLDVTYGTKSDSGVVGVPRDLSDIYSRVA
jgi:hypothetical protein